jgi:hypothetical protein
MRNDHMLQQSNDSVNKNAVFNIVVHPAYVIFNNILIIIIIIIIVMLLLLLDQSTQRFFMLINFY